MDGLEPSREMLDIAKTQNIYREYFVDTLKPNEKTQIKDGKYQ